MPIVLTQEGTGGLTFLQLCNRVARECGITRSAMSTVVGQAGVLADVVSRTADAWREIQGKQHWSWMWELAEPIILDGTSSITSDIPARRYVQDSGRIGTSILEYVPWERFRLCWRDTSTVGVPTVWSIRPDQILVFNYTVDGDTVFTVERYNNPTDLAADDDTPDAPGHLHMAIVWQAVMTYASVGEENANLYAAAEKKYSDILGPMLSEETQPIYLGGALC